MTGPLQGVPLGRNAVAEAYGWRTERRVDPIRGAALHEAIRAFPNPHFASELDPERAGKILATANMFEAWLEGPEQFAAYLAEDDGTLP